MFAEWLSATPIAELYGKDNGKTIGTHVEAAFNTHIERGFTYDAGNAASGIDFPGLDVDLKVTSVEQPQSSCPFRDAKQKIYGLGYDLLVFVYNKTDDPLAETATLAVEAVVFIPAALTADYQTTTGLLSILENDGNVDDIDAFIEERNLPVDDVGRRQLAERVLAEPPSVGYLTISNAQQWRLQYGRAIRMAGDGPGMPEDLRA